MLTTAVRCLAGRLTVHSKDMRANDLHVLLRAKPFEPIRIGLSDGRSILIRHPDQAVVAERHLLVGLTKIEQSRPLTTPKSAHAIARDWIIVNLLQITAIELEDGANGRQSRQRGKK